MTISAIVAISKNRVIGKNNQIPWYLPADLKYFKKTTLGHHILMGRKNFLSISRPLPGRTNMILTRDPYFTANGVLTVHSPQEAIEIAKENGEVELFIIGGGQVYDLCMPITERIYLTEVETEVEDGDVFFPELNPDDWRLISNEPHRADEKNKYNYTYKIFEREK